MKVRDIDLSENRVNAEHRALGLPPVAASVTALARPETSLRLTMWSVALLLAGLTMVLAARLLDQSDGRPALQLVGATLESREFWIAVAVGLLAQTVDGAAIKPFITVYALLMGLFVLSKVLRTVAPRRGAPRPVAKLGLMGTVIAAVSAFNLIVALR